MADRGPVVVAGGGMAGLVTSLLLARSGRAVRLVERDLRSGEDSAADALQERRAGVAQYHQPHAFMPRAYTLLRDRLPDVLAVLLRQGATEIDLAPAGDPQAGDEDLVFLGVRRPLIEWALRGAVASEPGIALHAGRITGLRWHEGPPARVCGVATDRGDVAGALVVDAMGRTSSRAMLPAAHVESRRGETPDVPPPMKIEIDDLSRPEIHVLLEEHLRSMHCLSPPESVHALDLERLRRPGITFWSAWDGPLLLGCAALKELDRGHGEIKSMRTPAALRRRGAGRALLAHIVDVARSRDYDRLSLETGSQRGFEPARRLYASFGFTPCGPFGDYAADPHSFFMSMRLLAMAGGAGPKP